VLQVCKKSRIPRELIPGILASSQILGQGILPYNTLTNNLIPAEILGTSIAGAPLIRMFGFFFCYIFIVIYFGHEKKRLSSIMTPEEIDDQFHLYDNEIFSDDLPSLFNSVFPVGCGIAFLVYMTNTSTLKPLYTVYVTLTIGIVLTILMNRKRLNGKNPIKILEQSFVSSVSSTVICGIVIGFGAVVALSPFFTEAVTWFQSINFNPYFQTVIVTSIFAAIMASTPGAVKMSCNIFGKYWASIVGINMNAMHAITTTSGLGLNTMPHNGSVIMCNERSHLPIKGTFHYTFITGGIIIMLGAFVQALAATILYQLG
jgi:H+/gluconate symporter-like permease